MGLRRTIKTVVGALEEADKLANQQRWPQLIKHLTDVLSGSLAADRGLPRQRQRALHILCTAYTKVCRCAVPSLRHRLITAG